MIMSRRNNFKNIQIQGKIELAELFEDTYQQSGANSKGEFLSTLLDEYLNPEEIASKKVEEIEKEKNELSGELQDISREKEEVEAENTVLQERLKHYENEFLTKVFTKNKGKKLQFKSTMTGKKMEIEINDPKDAFTAIIHSIQV